MAQKQKAIIALAADQVRHVWRTSGPTYSVINDGFEGIISSDSSKIEYTLYRFNGSDALIQAFDRLNMNVIRVDLQLYSYLADQSSPLIKAEFVEVSSGTSDTAIALWTAINSSSIVYKKSTSIQSNEKVLSVITIGDSSASPACTTLETAITSSGIFYVGIRSVSGIAHLGGLTMSRGIDTLWQENIGINIKDPPVLLISIEQDPESDNNGVEPIKHIMKYTTSDPSTNQSTPGNSLGGYMAPNNIYIRSQISESINTKQTTVTISSDSASSLPSSLGLAQVGPEIFKFTGIDTTNRQLTGIKRGISTSAYPAFVKPFGDYIHYLSVDSLFDRRPTSGLVQYRCVAITQVSQAWPSQEQTATSVKVELVNNNTSDVNIDIGIEVPAHDSHYGSVSAVSGSILSSTTTGSRGVSGFASGYFDGSFININNGTHESIIASYDMNGSIAEFILEDPIPSGVIVSHNFVIFPSPAQSISNESVKPSNNSGRFLGFFSEGGSNNPGIGGIREFSNIMRNDDVLYIWVKRIFTNNKKKSDDTGAVIVLIHKDIDL